MASAASSLLHAAAGILASASAPDAGGAGRSSGRESGVEHIDLDDDGTWPEEND